MIPYKSVEFYRNTSPYVTKDGYVNHTPLPQATAIVELYPEGWDYMVGDIFPIRGHKAIYEFRIVDVKLLMPIEITEEHAIPTESIVLTMQAAY